VLDELCLADERVRNGHSFVIANHAAE